ncbi:LPXTG cell wall anchor domain-containing protein [Streptomyces sp. NPDC054949]|uniref:LPXTG cell wall anchor domain-containing protein n=2 Tax=Streptomyces TaxID=1883 RepID=UPI002252596F|nr:MULTISPECIES: LPXTG cell wall anchor domain-containing protein [unclassified Streptomyces]MCX5075061.1 LPXTG cell wall anchor domain-containing protein [Streptomyces sp. NBC_00424]MCX5153322.1 LPXTG cell wall anchor domain-containing protein [Streptomyces sp. NBC_00291]WUD45894.1 LPXTG cell wall anchor domain-containing protein [Streptomyces sp. NBC_00513]
MSHRKRTTALALASALAGSAAVLTLAPSAHADVVDVAYNCATPIGDKSAVSPIDIKAVKAGDGYKLTMSFQKGVSSSPIELGKGAMSPSAVILVGGADKGSVPVSGPPNPEAVPADTPIKITDLSGTYTPKKSGKVTFTAGVLTIKAMGTTTTCTPGNSPKPSLELDVTAPGGAAAPPPPASTAAGGDSLPQTGPADSALALGTLGATVLLSGAAGVLWLTRRGRQARS